MERGKLATTILGETRRAVMGKDEILAKVLLTILAGGHILLEDIPGVGEITTALALSKTLSLRCNQVQFIPNMMLSNTTGLILYSKGAGWMEYQPGVVLCNLFLVDELNWATSRTQSALLEVMEEGQVIVDGVSYPIPQSFLVIVARNPVGIFGIQLLPDSQTGRFIVRPSIGYPAPAGEVATVRRRQGDALLKGVRPVLESNGLLALRVQVGQVYISDEMLDYVVCLVGATWGHSIILQGASPRVTLTLTAVTRTAVLVWGRDYILPESISLVSGDVVPHRLLLSPRAEADRPFDPVSELLERVPVPRTS